ncbi:hypothetical protein [Streptomyces sp. NPDC055105]|uniref:hypothetical protein n=1 Tax=Streptomyces sp. NPDC055105 TaxID=3365719 RepID=UPI0037CEBB25
MANYQVSGNLVWEAQIRQVASPGWEGGWDLTPEQEAHVLKGLFELFDKFLAEREGAASGREVASDGHAPSGDDAPAGQDASATTEKGREG